MSNDKNLPVVILESGAVAAVKKSFSLVFRMIYGLGTHPKAVFFGMLGAVTSLLPEIMTKNGNTWWLQKSGNDRLSKDMAEITFSIMGLALWGWFFSYLWINFAVIIPAYWESLMFWFDGFGWWGPWLIWTWGFIDLILLFMLTNILGWAFFKNVAKNNTLLLEDETPAEKDTSSDKE